MDVTLNNVNYKFIPQSFNDVKVETLLLKNDVFEKYKASADVTGEYVICRNTEKLKKKTKRLVKESFEEYLHVLETRDTKKDQWIYNIIDGIAEQDMILYQDEKFILLPTYVYDGNAVDNMHLLAIPRDKSIRSIRDLEENHIPLLKHMREQSLKSIKTKYGLREENLKMFFHYEPSTYHLHIHFVNVKHDFGSSVECSHDLDLVIFNLSIFSKYYKTVLLNKRCA